MPVRKTALKENTLANYKNHSYEYQTLTWLLNGGWEASIPAVDLGAKTDVQIADGKRLYRIQVKSLESNDDNITIENKWQGAQIDYVVYYSRTANWGYIVPAFSEQKKALKSARHVRFHQHAKSFLKAFDQV